MDTNTKQNDLKERFKKLPPDVQDAIFSTETANVIMKTGKENGLNIEQIGILGEETGNLMMGLTAPNEFISNLAEKLKIDKFKAKTIAETLNKEIFSKIRESLKKIHMSKETKPAETKEKREEKTTHFGQNSGQALRQNSGQAPQPSAGQATEKQQPKITPQIIKPQSYTGEIPQENVAPQKEEIVRSKAEVIEKREPQEKPKKPIGLKSYPEGKDPYREPLD